MHRLELAHAHAIGVRAVALRLPTESFLKAA